MSMWKSEFDICCLQLYSSLFFGTEFLTEPGTNCFTWTGLLVSSCLHLPALDLQHMSLCATFSIAAGDLAVSWHLQASALLAEPSPQTPTCSTDTNVPQQTLMDSSWSLLQCLWLQISMFPLCLPLYGEDSQSKIKASCPEKETHLS